LSTQRYDRQAIIEGSLEQLGDNPNAAWADTAILHDRPRTMASVRALHVKRSDGRRELHLTLRKFDDCDERGYFAKMIKLSLDNDGVEGLLSYLRAQSTLKQVSLGERYLLAEGSVVPAETARAMAELISNGTLTVAELDNIHAAAQHAAYRAALAELRALLQDDDAEATYQRWFEDHPWVFGTSYVGREDARKVGLHDQVDMILRTADGYLDIVELKTPSAKVLVHDRGRDIWRWSADASGAIGQCAKYLRGVEEKRHLLQVEEGLPFIKPRGRIVIGRCENWPNDKREALRTLNAALHGMEIWTYDHVLAMGRQLVACYEPTLPDNITGEGDDDDPFADV